MQPFQALRGLASIAVVIAVCLESCTSATPGELAPQAFDMTNSVDRSDLSPCAKQLFERNQDDAEPHLKASKVRYDELHTKIKDSISKGNFIHVEDGESDDLWQNLLGVMAGSAPTKVFLHGGHWKLRLRCAHIMWDYFCNKFSIEKPEIMVLHGNTKGSLQPFDDAEGIELLRAREIQKLKDASLDITTDEYKNQIEEARQSLRKTLADNEFTTIALKTAPAGLVEIIEEFKDKVAIIWTGPVERRPKSSSWVIKHNYYQAPIEGDKLLAMGAPIVITSPWIANARMNAIIDKQFVSEYQSLLPEGTSFVPTDLSFPGFDHLGSIPLDPSTVFSHYILSLADGLKKKMMEVVRVEEQKYEAQRLNILNQNIDASSRSKALEEAESAHLSKTLLGRRWKQLESGDTKGRVFREFCPVDHAVQVVTDPALNECVQEVVEVEMRRPDTAKGKVGIDVRPMLGSNIFIISQFFSPPLEDQIQLVIDWMAQGEKPHHNLLTAHSTQTSTDMTSKSSL